MNEDVRLQNFLIEIRQISKLVFLVKNNALKEKGLKQIHTMILFFLYLKGPLTNAELVKLSKEDKAAISKACHLLKNEDLVIFNNGYKEKIMLTEEGKTLAEEIRKDGHLALSEARKGISDEEAKVFVNTLSKIRLNLESYLKISN